MIKLVNIINEIYERPLDRTKEISKEKFNEMLPNFNEAIESSKKGNVIYRGLVKKIKFGFISPSQYTRRSSNSTNIYNSLIDILPSWKNYPKRSNSVICTTSVKMAHDYGTVYEILPKNGAVIGICSSGDFWWSFDYMEKRMNKGNLKGNKFIRTIGMNDFDESIFQIINDILKMKVKEEEFIKDNILNILHKMDDKMKKIDLSKTPKMFLSNDFTRATSMMYIFWEDIKNNYKGSWVNYFNKLLNPEKNGFRLTTISNFEDNGDVVDGNEIWTESDCLVKLNNSGEYDPT